MRYFLDVAYKGSRYAGFQVQKNANTIQSEVHKALETVLRLPVELTGSSRTDAGVHALQNFFHFDTGIELKPAIIYNVNAVLPPDIVVKSIVLVAPQSHCRFLATSRQYNYFITEKKDPFATDTAWYYPYKLDISLLNKAAAILFNYFDFTSFSKRNTQVHTYNCTIMKSEWYKENNTLVYNVEGNRFLRGMVRGLVGTMLLVGRNKISLSGFEVIIQSKDPTKANFATPSHGLFLVAVNYPMHI
jgi:tRNA pseudouridine38-40 synthase